MSAAEKHVPEIFTGDTVRASWPFSLQSIRSNIHHCSPEGREALISAFLWCIDPKHPVRRADFARAVGYSENTIYKIYTGKYVDAANGRQLDVPAKLVTSIKEFLALERERFLGGKKEFVLTPTAKRIFLACDIARESQTPVFLWGRSHIGKTWALEQYAQDNDHGKSVYIRMKAIAGVGGMVRRICERLGISPKCATADLVDRIKNAVTPNMLLLLDEVHLLMYTYRIASFFACMEVLREIHDETSCGMVICGTKILLEKISQGAQGEMEQFLRRGVHRFALPDMPTKKDLAAIFEHHGLEFPARDLVLSVQGIKVKPYDVIRYLAKDHGLKAITERIRYGKKLAGRAGEDFTWNHVVRAHLTISTESPDQERTIWE